MGNSSAPQHSRWRMVCPDSSLLDFHEGQSSRSSEVPNALVCWETNRTKRSPEGTWAPKALTTMNVGPILTEPDQMEKFQSVGFYGDKTDYQKEVKKKERNQKNKNVKPMKNLHVNDDFVSQPMVRLSFNSLSSYFILKYRNQS